MACPVALQGPVCAPASRRALSSRGVRSPLMAAQRARPASKRVSMNAQAVAVSPSASRGSGDSSGPVKLILANLRGHLLHESGQQVAKRDSDIPHEMLQKNWFTEDWVKAKSSWRFLRHVWHLRRSTILRAVLIPTFATFFATLAIGYYATHIAPVYHYPPLVKIGYPFLAFVTSVLSFLLVFRTNNSYARFDEARKLWGGVWKTCRDICRQATTFFPRTDRGRRACQALARWCVALSHCLRCGMRLPREELENTLHDWLLPEELALLAAADHRPGTCMQVIGEIIFQNASSDVAALLMDENTRVFQETIGGCERIYRTPIPVSYTSHTARFLMAWAAIVPLALWWELQWAALFFAPLCTFLLFAIEEIGVQLEEPFSVLPLAAICEIIRANTQEIVSHCGEAQELVAKVLEGASTQIEAEGHGGGGAPVLSAAALAAAAADEKARAGEDD